jgi:hypothetical protein
VVDRSFGVQKVRALFTDGGAVAFEMRSVAARAGTMGWEGTAVSRSTCAASTRPRVVGPGLLEPVRPEIITFTRSA